jgi:hypothetical protein
VEVTPQESLVEVGAWVQLAAVARDAEGNALPDRTVTWASADPAVATVTPNGRAEGVATGWTTVTAESEGKADTASVTVVHAPVTLVGAGDIADCATLDDEATADLLDTIPGTVFTLGDNAYEDGTPDEFDTCYDPTWGRHKDRTFPAVGNHEYHTAGAAGHFAYFGAAAGDPTRGYYSYELGAWKIVVLNSNAGKVSVAAGSEQEQWLRAELSSDPRLCTLAYWHHPRFSSGFHGDDETYQALWQALYDGGSDVVLTGHDHHYERLAPLSDAGELDPAGGIRQFVVGTGGRLLRPAPFPRPHSEVRDSETFGVLQFTLRHDSYDWEFVPVAGQTFTDQGSGACH